MSISPGKWTWRRHPQISQQNWPASDRNLASVFQILIAKVAVKSHCLTLAASPSCPERVVESGLGKGHRSGSMHAECATLQVSLCRDKLHSSRAKASCELDARLIYISESQQKTKKQVQKELYKMCNVPLSSLSLGEFGTVAVHSSTQSR